MKTICLIAAAALFILGAAPEMTLLRAEESSVSAPAAAASENESVIRFWLQRDGDTNVVHRVDYGTKDGTALAGVDYVATAGTVSFAPGQTALSIEVPLIDNGSVNGERFFELVSTNANRGGFRPTFGWCRPDWFAFIEDNELPPTRVDPFFLPDRGADPLFAMPDGRLLIQQGSAPVLSMLQSNGWVDPTFRPEHKEEAPPFRLLHVFSDGKILTQRGDRFVRHLPGGGVDAVLLTPAWTSTIWPITRYEFRTAQPDGKLLMILITSEQAETILYRFNADGSLDEEFLPGKFSPEFYPTVVVQPDGKILVGGRFDQFNGVARPALVRLNGDGSPDETFSYNEPFPGYSLTLRTNGKIILSGEWVTQRVDRAPLIQLNEDGRLDSGFSTDLKSGLADVVMEQPDGRLLVIGRGRCYPPYLDDRFIRLNPDGTLDKTFSPYFQAPGRSCYISSVAVTGSGQILVAGDFNQVDGFPRRGLVRLIDSLPQRDFRVLASEFSRSFGAARIQVVRTGETTAPALVDFATVDATAKAGTDYVAQRGTLNFAPFEVSKEVIVPLLGRTGVLARLSFMLELSRPSAGYTNTVATPILIHPDLRLATESQPRLADNVITLTLRGTLPGIIYALEGSGDLKNWETVGSWEATGNTTAMVFNWSVPWWSANFFRARRQ